MKLAAVILAAGASRRMGRPKLLLPWGESTVLDHLLRQWQEVGAGTIGVVCAAPRPDEHDHHGVEWIVNPAPERGMFSSIQTAARWPGWETAVTHWAVVLGDQSHLRLETLQAVWRRAQREPEKIVQPFLADRGRHPVVLPRAHFLALAQAPENNLKEFLQNRPAAIVWEEVADSGLARDMDTPQDYEELQRLRG